MRYSSYKELQEEMKPKLEEIRKINTAIANKTTIKKKTAKKTNKEVKSEKLITITGEIDSKTDIFNLSNASIKFLTENKNIAKEISKIINNILNDKKEEVKEPNIEKLNSIIRKCEDKIIEIKDIIKDFDYSDKKTYEELTSKVENDLKELENIKNVNKINEIIDEINKIYRNAYNKKIMFLRFRILWKLTKILI